MANDKNDEEKVEEINETGNDSNEVAISREKIGGEVPIVVTELTDKCLYTGFFGTLDSTRMQKIIEKILELLDKSEIEIIIVDLSNIDVLDSAVAAHLIKMTQTIKLTGCRTIFCGVRPILAQTIVAVGSDVSNLIVNKNLKSALKEVFRYQGLELVPVKGSIGESEVVREDHLVE